MFDSTPFPRKKRKEPGTIKKNNWETCGVFCSFQENLCEWLTFSIPRFCVYHCLSTKTKSLDPVFFSRFQDVRSNSNAVCFIIFDPSTLNN